MQLKKPVARSRFISAMRTVASSVTVVTSDGPAGCAGATVSAFSSVSADPPTVLVCLNATSRIARTVADNGRFCVNVLPETGQHIADRFAGRHDDHIACRFEGIDCYDSQHCGAIIAGATAFSCKLDQIIHSGSHLITLGLVQSVLSNTSPPLAYHNGSYQRVVQNEQNIHRP